MTEEEIAKRHCKFELCTHRTGEGICCLFNQDNCIFRRLEKENEELRNNGFTVSAMTEQQLKVALEKGEQLEKENAELKKANQTLATMKNDMWVELEKKRAESQGITNKLHLLTKAKEIIEKLISLNRKEWVYSDVREQAEQFLKEIEK